MISKPVLAAVMIIGGAAATLPLLAQSGTSRAPVARYDMRAGTVSGLGAMGSRPSLGAVLGGGLGGGNSVQHELYLRLGSSQAPTGGAPKADHFPPATARLGKSVALVTPREERGMIDELPQKPRGRMLLYWGCGEHAPRGQPVVIDFSKLAAGQVPPGLWTSTIIRDWGPSLQNSRTFGRWPAEDGKYAKADTALPGPHRVVSNYAPEMAFTLAKDFMAPLRVSTSALPSGASSLSWGGIPDATGYVAVLFGGKQSGGGEMMDIVMWSSSASRQFGGGLADWLSPGQVAGLVRDRTVMSPSTTTCTVPAEVLRDAPNFRFGTLTAFGPEENFAYPARPAAPQWTARIRHRSSTTWMQAPGFSAGEAGGRDAAAGQQQCQPRRRGFGGLLGGALGVPSGC